MRIKKCFLILALVAAAFSAAFVEVNSVSITSVVPPNPNPGDMVAVTFSYCVNAYEESRFMLAVSDTSAFRPNNTAGQVFKVSELGENVTSASVNGGYSLGDNQSAAHCETRTFNVNIPSDLGEGGTFYIIVGGRAYYTAPDQVASQNYASFTIPYPPAGASITKTAETAVVRPGDYVLYTINYNFVNANNFVITDYVPSNCTLISQSMGGTSSGTTAGSALTWALGNTLARKTGSVWFIAQVDASAPPSTVISNTAHWSLDEVPAGGDSNTASITTAGPTVLVKSQLPASPATAAIGDTITYTLDFNTGGMGFYSYDTFDDAASISGFTAVGGGIGFSWMADGTGGGAIFSGIQGGTNYPHFTRNTPSDFCFGEITGDVWIGDTTNKDGLIVFRDNRMTDPNGKAYGLGISSDATPANMYLQEVNPPEILGPPPYRALANPFTAMSNTWYTLKILVTDAGNGAVRIRGKAWVRGTAEPGVWHVDWTDTSGSVPPCGYVGFQGHPTNSNMYDNLKVIKSNPTSPVVYDTIPSIITYAGGTAGDTTHGPATLSGGMVRWEIFTPLTPQNYSLTWWGTVNFCGDAYNKFTLKTDESAPVDSNSTTLNVPVCPESPTITPTHTVTATSTQTVTVTFTPTVTPTRTPVLYPTIVLAKSGSPNPADPGGTVNYTINYSNTGPVAATNLSIIDALSTNLSYVPGSASAPGSHSGPTPGGQVSWVIPSVAPGGSGSVTFSAIVASNLIKGTQISNSASATCFESSTPVVSNNHLLSLNIPDLVLKPVTNYPNPAQDNTVIVFNLTVAAEVTIKFFTLSGEPVLTMEKEDVNANLVGQSAISRGDNRVRWNCKNKHNQDVASGIYFYRVDAKSAAGEHAFYISKLAVMR